MCALVVMLVVGGVSSVLVVFAMEVMVMVVVVCGVSLKW